MPSPDWCAYWRSRESPQTWADVRTSKHADVWHNALRAEFTGYELNGPFSADVVPEGVNVITAKWVSTWKTDSGGLITKAKTRLVARGFGQRHGVDFFETFAATPSVSSIKVAIATAVMNGWPLFHLDVEQA